MTAIPFQGARPFGRRQLAIPLFVLLGLYILGLLHQPQFAAPYFDHQAQNLEVFRRDTLRHPGSVIQNTLGLLLGLGTWGDRRDGYGGTWTYYENAGGLGTIIPRLSGRDSIAVGNFVFSTGSMRRNPLEYWHEYRHYQQSTEMGLRFVPAYVSGLVTHGYDNHPLERDAERWAWRYRRSRVV